LEKFFSSIKGTNIIAKIINLSHSGMNPSLLDDTKQIRLQYDASNPRCRISALRTVGPSKGRLATNRSVGR
jgi:hypothetical protein